MHEGFGVDLVIRTPDQRLRGRFGSGSVFVPLAGVSQPEQVLGGIARAVGAELGGAGSPRAPG